MRPLSQRVKDGAKFLDEKCPDWIHKIDIELLSMTNPCKCILGQGIDDYSSAKDQLSIDEDIAIDMGFNLHPDEALYIYDMMNKAQIKFDVSKYWKELWVNEINQRFAKLKQETS